MSYVTSRCRTSFSLYVRHVEKERESAGLTTCRPREAPGNKVVLTGHVNTCPTGVSVVVFHMAARLGLETTIF